MNPWKIIGWIVLAFFLLALTFCGLVCVRVAQNAPSPSASATGPSAAPRPSYSLKVISIECEKNHGRNKASITATNTGAIEIPFAKVFVQFTDKAGAVVSADDSYFRPTSIPAGATASATAYAKEGAPNAEKCGIATIQDGDGNPVSFTN